MSFLFISFIIFYKLFAPGTQDDTNGGDEDMGDLFSEEDEDMGYTLNEGETIYSNYYTPLFEILTQKCCY